jgi:hypothetical protein
MNPQAPAWSPSPVPSTSTVPLATMPMQVLNSYPHQGTPGRIPYVPMLPPTAAPSYGSLTCRVARIYILCKCILCMCVWILWRMPPLCDCSCCGMMFFIASVHLSWILCIDVCLFVSILTFFDCLCLLLFFFSFFFSAGWPTDTYPDYDYSGSYTPPQYPNTSATFNRHASFSAFSEIYTACLLFRPS